MTRVLYLCRKCEAVKSDDVMGTFQIHDGKQIRYFGDDHCSLCGCTCYANKMKEKKDETILGSNTTIL